MLAQSVKIKLKQIRGVAKKSSTDPTYLRVITRVRFGISAQYGKYVSMKIYVDENIHHRVRWEDVCHCFASTYCIYLRCNTRVDLANMFYVGSSPPRASCELGLDGAVDACPCVGGM